MEWKFLLHIATSWVLDWWILDYVVDLILFAILDIAILFANSPQHEMHFFLVFGEN